MLVVRNVFRIRSILEDFDDLSPFLFRLIPIAVVLPGGEIGC